MEEPFFTFRKFNDPELAAGMAGKLKIPVYLTIPYFNSGGWQIKRPSPKQLLIITGAFLGWSSLIFQFYLILANRQASVPETIIRYFTFFTILTNLLVALCFTFLLLDPHSRAGKFFSSASTLTAITTYIILVGIVYNVVLRFLWNPQGLQKLVDELLHTVNPLLFLLFWILFVPKTGLQWRSVFVWLILPGPLHRPDFVAWRRFGLLSLSFCRCDQTRIC